MTDHETLYKVIAELRLVAAAGLHFAAHHYERERYERVQQACAQLIAVVEHTTSEAAARQLAGDIFDQRISPLSTVDAVVLREGRVLLIKRHDNGLWALPGGLVEINQTLSVAVLRELHEETRLSGRIRSLIGIFDSHRWESQEKVHMHHAVFLVDAPLGTPQATEEARAVDFFAEDELPPLAPGHHRRVPFIIRLLREGGELPYIDPPI